MSSFALLRQRSGLFLGWIPLGVIILQVQPAASQTAVYAAISGTQTRGVFRSTDGGLTWNAVNQGLSNLSVRSLAVDPRNGNTLYAGTGGGIYKSTNGGASWSAANSSLTATGIDAIVIDPGNPDTLYAARSLFFGNGGVFKSTNGGATWIAVNNGLPTSVPTVSAALAINPTASNTLYASFGGTFKSVDGGANWSQLQVGGGGGAIAVDPGTPGTVYNVGPFSIWSMHKSIDHGANWTNITPSSLNVIFGFSLAVDASGTVYAGIRRTCMAPSGVCGAVIKSTDGGTTWRVVLEASNADVFALAIDPVDQSTIYAGGGAGFGLFKTTDGGANWVPVNAGLMSTSVAALAVAPAQGLHFIPVTPCRIADTREANGVYGGPILTGGVSRTFPLTGKCGIPATAKAYSINATVVPTGPLGHLTVWPSGQAQPVVSTLNALDGQVTANAAIVPAGSGGNIEVYVTNDTHLVLDINGYFDDPPAGLAFYPLTPCRVLDTRTATGSFGGPPIAAGTSRSFPIRSSQCGVPAGAEAYAFNVTVVPSGPLGHLTAWPTGQPQPVVSTLNALDGQVTANMAVMPAGTSGDVTFFATNTTHLVVDINGYFGPAGSPGALRYYALQPCRLVDTRNAAGPLGGPLIAGGISRSFPLPQSSCGIPLAAQAYSLNFTVVPSGILGHLTAWPAGQIQPLASTLNALDGQVTANAAIVPAGAAGALSVFATNQTHVIVDTNGYFAP